MLENRLSFLNYYLIYGCYKKINAKFCGIYLTMNDMYGKKRLVKGLCDLGVLLCMDGHDCT